jgi:RNA polymerase subunit RPABC4/transcription elongation factor Spt4
MDKDLLDLRDRAEVPDQERNLEACPSCGLILSRTQWRQKKNDCPNGCGSVESTPYFSGMISMITPTLSWVAKYNAKTGFLPGIYAMNIEKEIEGNDMEDVAETAGKPLRNVTNYEDDGMASEVYQRGKRNKR